MVMSGFSRLIRIPAFASSLIRISKCFSFQTSTRRTIMSAERTTEITSLPLPLPIAAPAIIPGMSSTWIFAPRCSSAPGITVTVVKE